VGKTTAVLHAAATVGNRLVYVRAQDMPNEFGSMGTNYLMQNILRGQEILGDYDDVTKKELEGLAGPVLASLLRKPENGYVVIIDGLDEHHTYSSLRGIMLLTNELAELACPVVLTTRKEHLDSTSSNFEAMFEKLSRAGANRQATIIELQAWTNTEVDDFICHVEQHAHDRRLGGVLKLIDDFRTGVVYNVFGDLPRNPLFLQMMFDLAADNLLDVKTRVEVIRHWVSEKIKRDIQVSRATPVEVIDGDTFVDRMLAVMEVVAYQMTTRGNGRTYLAETMASTGVEEIAQTVFESKHIDISRIVTTSVLLPTHRRSRSMRIRFFHRLLHEYFVACYLRSHNQSADGFPDAVGSLFREMETAGGGDD